MKKVLIIFILIVVSFKVSGQFIRLSDNCNPLMRSLNEVVYVVKQDYLLMDKDGKVYGKDGKDYFGYAYGAGVLIDGELAFSNYVFKSFQNDSTIMAFGDDYKPKAGNTFYKKIKETKPTLANPQNVISTPLGVHIQLPDSIAQIKYNTVSLENKMKCVVVTFLKRSQSVNDATPYDLSYVFTEVEWQNNTGKLTINEFGNDAMFGLIFYEKIGHGEASMVLGGFLDKVNDKWEVSKYTNIKPIQTPPPNTPPGRGRRN